MEISWDDVNWIIWLRIGFFAGCYLRNDQPLRYINDGRFLVASQ